jgi:hypothetical protein
MLVPTSSSYQDMLAQQSAVECRCKCSELVAFRDDKLPTTNVQANEGCYLGNGKIRFTYCGEVASANRTAAA